MNFSLESKLRDFIIVENMLDESICEESVDMLERCVWESHTWHDAGRGGVRETMSNDPDIIFSHERGTNTPFVADISLRIKQRILDNFRSEKYPLFDQSKIVSEGTPIRFNRYQNGQHMRPHIDHIRSAFDGHPTQVGIPILSVLSVFNDDFDDGEFCFWGEPIDLKPGDVLIFPSIFLYQHEVKPVTRGTRYTGIFWMW